MLDGVFNPPPKRNSEDLISDEDDEDMEAHASERNIETENAEIEPETNNESTKVSNKTSTEPIVSSSTHEVISTQGVSNNTTLETNRSPSPSVLNMPTTFGSENITSHRLLRKSLNLSRNNSIDSNGTSKNDQINQPNKIRIEARIDSDKITPNSYKNDYTERGRTRQGLRYNIRYTNKNVNAELDGDLFPNPKPREPEIIEKILSPSKTKSVSAKPTKDLQHTSNPERTTRVIEGNMSKQKDKCEYIQKENPLSQHTSLRSTDSNLMDDEVNNKISRLKIINNF